jgi:hypothetical protein
MQPVNVKGYGVVPFPDDISVDEIRATLRRRYTDQADNDLLQGALEYGAPTGNVAAPYNPSLMERTAQGIGGALYDSGIISNRAGAQQIGKNVTSIGELLPGIGDVAAADDTIRAYNKGNYGEAALNAVGVVPLLGDAAIFAGVLAKNADLGALRKAKLLEDTGADRNRIWKETGWANDNGDWKFEISDALDFDTGKGADINPSSFDMIKDYGGTTQGNFLGHPDVYEAYPNLTDRPVKSYVGGGAKYNSSTDTISMGDSLLNPNSASALDDTQSTNLHELQHAIQNREGFVSGGAANKHSVELAKKQITENLAPISEAVNKIEASPEYISRLSELREQGYRKSGARIIADKEFGLDNLNKKLFSQTPLEKAIYDKDAGNYNAYESYKRLGGEAEARNVQTRMNMTPDERRANPPWETLDVPEDELIYRGGGGVSKSQAPVDAANSIKPVDGKKLITNGGDEYFELPSGEIVTDLNSKDVIFKDAKEARGYLDGLYSEGSYKYNAVQQGYTGEIKGTKAKKNKLYHGTSDDIESFDKSKLQARDDGAIGTGVYVTSSPKIAESYANMSSPRFKSDKTGDYVEPNIIPISTRAEKTKIFSLAEKLDFMKEMNGNRNFSKELTKKLKKEGYDSSAVVDVNGDLIEMNIFEPEMVRASHAKFDPKNKGSASLLGGLGALGVGIGSRSRSDEEYE